MTDTEVTIPNPLPATCIDCEARRHFDPVDSDTDEILCVYECEDCGQQLELRLDP
jgi:hypothetical protein